MYYLTYSAVVKVTGKTELTVVSYINTDKGPIPLSALPNNEKKDFSIEKNIKALSILYNGYKFYSVK